jgi:hypothetical protein
MNAHFTFQDALLCSPSRLTGEILHVSPEVNPFEGGSAHVALKLIRFSFNSFSLFGWFWEWKHFHVDNSICLRLTIPFSGSPFTGRSKAEEEQQASGGAERKGLQTRSRFFVCGHVIVKRGDI